MYSEETFDSMPEEAAPRIVSSKLEKYFLGLMMVEIDPLIEQIIKDNTYPVNAS